MELNMHNIEWYINYTHECTLRQQCALCITI